MAFSRGVESILLGNSSKKQTEEDEEDQAEVRPRPSTSRSRDRPLGDILKSSYVKRSRSRREARQAKLSESREGSPNFTNRVESSGSEVSSDEDHLARSVPATQSAKRGGIVKKRGRGKANPVLSRSNNSPRDSSSASAASEPLPRTESPPVDISGLRRGALRKGRPVPVLPYKPKPPRKPRKPKQPKTDSLFAGLFAGSVKQEPVEQSDSDNLDHEQEDIPGNLLEDIPGNLLEDPETQGQSVASEAPTVTASVAEQSRAKALQHAVQVSSSIFAQKLAQLSANQQGNTREAALQPPESAEHSHSATQGGDNQGGERQGGGDQPGDGNPQPPAAGEDHPNQEGNDLPPQQGARIRGGGGGGPGDDPSSSSSSTSDNEDGDADDSDTDDEVIIHAAAMAEAQIALLKAETDRFAILIDKITASIDDKIGDYENHYVVKSLLDRLNDTLKQISEKETKVVELSTRENLEQNVAPYQQLKVVIDGYKAKAREFIKEAEATETPLQANSIFAFSKRSLQKFDGTNVEDYFRFKAEFKSIAKQFESNKHVTNLDLFNLLRDYCTGEPLKVIKGLTAKPDSYNEAWSMLEELYNKPLQRLINYVAPIIDCRKASGKNDGYNYSELQRLHTTFYTFYKSIESANADPEQLNPFLWVFARRTFPDRLIHDWDDDSRGKVSYQNLSATTATFKEFLDFALARLKTQLGSERSGQAEKHKDQTHGPKRSSATRQGGAASGSGKSASTQNKKCGLCSKAGHPAIKCEKWQKVQPADLIKLIRDKNLCMICAEDHWAKDCPKKECTCGRKHNSKLCQAFSQMKKKATKGSSGKKGKGRGGTTGKSGGGKSHSTRTGDPTEIPDPPYPDTPQGSPPPTPPPEMPQLPDPPEPPILKDPFSAHHTTQHAPRTFSVQARKIILDTVRCTALLKTAEGHNISRQVRVFLDTGSEINLITRKAAEGAVGVETTADIEVTSGKRVASKEKIIGFKLLSDDGQFITSQHKATTLSKVTSPFKPVDVNPKAYDHLKNLDFTEDYPSEELEIDILVGNEICGQILLDKTRRGKKTEPFAKKTKLGWVLSGVY